MCRQWKTTTLKGLAASGEGWEKKKGETLSITSRPGNCEAIPDKVQLWFNCSPFKDGHLTEAFLRGGVNKHKAGTVIVLLEL
jgi:hypothetical protein